MTIYTVGEGGEYPTIATAAAVVKPGDTVELMTGIYFEALKATVPNVTWRAAAGHAPILDGGYSFEWAKKSGDGWRDLVYKSPLSGDVVVVKANGVTLDGLGVRNSGNAGISVGAFDNVTIRNCDIFHTYRTSIVVNGTGGEATNILIENNRCNVASVCIFDPLRKQDSPQGVSGTIKAGNCRDVVIRGNVVSRGFGEGIDIGKDAQRVVCEDNIVYDCNHIHIYVNHCLDVEVRHNVVFNSGDPAHLSRDGKAPCGIALRDEETKKGQWPISQRVTFVGNTVVNQGYPFLLNAENGSGGAFVVDRNTFIWGPLARSGVTIVNRQDGVYSNNTHQVPAGKTPTSNTPSGMVFRSNKWSVEPPAAWRGEGDEYGPLKLRGAEVMPTAPHEPFGMGVGFFDIDLTNYQTGEVEPPPPPPEEPPVPWRERLDERERVLIANCEEFAAGLPTWLPDGWQLQLLGKLAGFLDER